MRERLTWRQGLCAVLLACCSTAVLPQLPDDRRGGGYGGGFDVEAAGHGMGGRSFAALDPLTVVDDERLDQMRGGFEIELGLKLSFGFERVSYINGSLVSTQTVNLPELSLAAHDRLLAETLIKAADIGLIQNGSGNSFTLDGTTLLNGTVIQNAVDNQRIETRTVIDSTVNSLQLLRAINLRSALQDGIVGSLRR